MNPLAFFLSKIDIKTDIFVAVFVVAIVYLGASSDLSSPHQVILFAPIAILLYFTAYILNHKVMAMLYFAALFFGMVTYSITPFGIIMLSDFLFPGLALSLLISNKLSKDDLRSPIFISLVVFCGFSIFSGLVGIPFMQAKMINNSIIDPRYIAVIYIYRFIQLPVVYLFVIDNLKESNVIKKIVIFCILLQLFIAFFEIFVFPTNTADFAARARGTLYPLHMVIGQYLITSIPILMACFTEKTGAIIKTFWGIIVSYTVYVIVAAASRGSTLGLAAMFGSFVFFNIRFNKKSIIILVASIILIFLTYRFTPVQSHIDRTFIGGAGNFSALDVSSVGRFFIWQGALNASENSSLLHKIIGNGPGSFVGLDLGVLLFDNERHSPGGHNQILHLLVEVGIVGIILFLIHSGIIILQFLKRKDFLSLVFVCMTIGLHAVGLTYEVFLPQNNWWIYYITVLGIFVARTSPEKTIPIQDNKKGEFECQKYL